MIKEGTRQTNWAIFELLVQGKGKSSRKSICQIKQIICSLPLFDSCCLFCITSLFLFFSISSSQMLLSRWLSDTQLIHNVEYSESLEEDVCVFVGVSAFRLASLSLISVIVRAHIEWDMRWSWQILAIVTSFVLCVDRLHETSVSADDWISEEVFLTMMLFS